MAEIDYGLIATVGTIATAAATIALVFILWRTVKHMEATVELSRVQTEHRFRPWIGPANSIQHIGIKDGRYQFDVVIKNFGEIPSTNVMASFTMKNKLMTKDELKELESDHRFSLGPLLPNMEKHYWFFIDSEQIDKSKNGDTPIYISLYFEYEAVGKKSGYGMISQYIPDSNSFVHKDMWVTITDSK